MSTNYGDRIYNLEQSSWFKKPRTLTKLTNGPFYTGNITLSQSIKDFDATLIYHSFDDTRYTDITIRPLWIWQLLYEMAGGKYEIGVSVADFSDSAKWFIRASDIFSTTWRKFSESSVIHDIYGVKW